MNGQVMWRKYLVLTGREKRLFIEAVLLHLWTGLLLKVVPFKHIPRLFGNQEVTVGNRQFGTPAKEEAQSRHIVAGQQSEVIEMIRSAIQRAGKVSPWKNRCLVSSLAGRYMLRRRGIHSHLSLGVVRVGGERIRAHAWLTSGDIEIIAKSGDYTEMYRF